MRQLPHKVQFSFFPNKFAHDFQAEVFLNKLEDVVMLDLLFRDAIFQRPVAAFQWFTTHKQDSIRVPCSMDRAEEGENEWVWLALLVSL